MKRNIAVLALCVALMGCASTTQYIQQTLGPPAQVQAEVGILAALASAYVPQSDKPIVHSFAVGLAQGNPQTVPPVTGHPKTDALIKAAAAFVNLAVTLFGANNPMAAQYAQAVGNGLLTAF